MLLGNIQISYPNNVLQKLWKWHTYFTEKKTFFFFFMTQIYFCGSRINVTTNTFVSSTCNDVQQKIHEENKTLPNVKPEGRDVEANILFPDMMPGHLPV